MTEDVLRTRLLDRHIKEVFDWSDSNIPVEGAIWNYSMEENGKSTLRTEEDMLPFLKDSDDKTKVFVNESLRK